MSAIVVDIRFECIIYAKTINLARRFSLIKAIETASNNIPCFRTRRCSQIQWTTVGIQQNDLEMEYWSRRYFSGGHSNGVVECKLFCLSHSKYSNPFNWFILSLAISLVSFVLLFLTHVLGYLLISKKKDSEWKAEKKTLSKNPPPELPEPITP